MNVWLAERVIEESERWPCMEDRRDVRGRLGVQRAETGSF